MCVSIRRFPTPGRQGYSDCFLPSAASFAAAGGHLITFRVLGCVGYLGLFSVRILSLLKEIQNRSTAKSFDFICGTSAGAITALSLVDIITSEVGPASMEIDAPPTGTRPESEPRAVAATGVGPSIGLKQSHNSCR